MVSVGGMLVTALMLGIVSETISDKIEDLKKGTSDVLEDNHRRCPSQAHPCAVDQITFWHKCHRAGYPFE